MSDFKPSPSDLAGDLKIGDDVSLSSDSAVLNFGAGNDVTFTHDGGTGLDIASAGDFDIAVSAGNGTFTIADTKTLTLGKTSHCSIVIAPHSTAGSELLTIANVAGTSAAAIGLTTTAGGLTITSGATTAVEAVTITASQTTKDVLQITADAVTTGIVMDVTADALTTGGILNLVSDSSSTSTRSLATIINDNTASKAARCLSLQQDSAGISFLIDVNNSTTTTEATSTYEGGGFGFVDAMKIDFDKSGIIASGQQVLFNGINFDMDDSANNAGTSYMTGIDMDITSANAGDGTTINTGLNVNVSGADSNYALVAAAGDVTLGTSTTSGGQLHIFGNIDSYAARVINDGNNANRTGVYIQCGVDTPSAGECDYLLFADGNAGAAGGVTNGSTAANPEFFNGSDERVKTNIASTQIEGLNIINGLELIQFNWNPDFCSKQTLNKIGFRAQNCEQVYPDMVTEHPHENYDFPVKSVAKGELIPVLVKAVQELSQNNQDLTARIIELEQKLTD